MRNVVGGHVMALALGGVCGAAGTALAMALGRGQSHCEIVTVLLGSVFLAVVGRLMRPWLRDLT